MAYALHLLPYFVHLECETGRMEGYYILIFHEHVLGLVEQVTQSKNDHPDHKVMTCLLLVS